MSNGNENVKDKINSFYSVTANDISKIEENTVIGRPADLTYKEIHVIEAVAGATDGGKPARALDIAAALRVVPSTFTAAAVLLEKKGYLIRTRDESDGRGVKITLTASGEAACEMHRAFHRELAEEIAAAAGSEGGPALLRSFDALHAFYLRKEGSLKSGAVKILADSTCDLNPDESARLGVSIIPMSIIFGDAIYRQNLDLTPSEFYGLMRESKEPPVTSQLTPHDLEQTYRNALADGGEAVAIHLSSALSGTYQSAVLASREVAGVYPVDSQNATLGSALLTRTAVNLRDTGMRASEIARRLSELSERIILLAYIPNLKYLGAAGVCRPRPASSAA